MTILVTPHSYIADLLGRPLERGTMTVGVAGQDPDIAPLACFWDVAMTLPAAQPIGVSQGYIVNAGARADVCVAASSYSLRVRDAVGRQVDFIADASAGTASASLDSPAFTGTPTAPTQPAGDQSNALATDQFVWEHGFAWPGALMVLMASTALTPAILDGGVWVQGAGVTVTLPDLTGTVAGQTVTVAAGPNGCEVAPVANETIVDNLGNAVSPTPAAPASLALAPGQSAVFASQGTAGPWRAVLMTGSGGGGGMVGYARGLAIVTGAASSVITAASVVLGNSAGATFTAVNVNVTAAIGAVGVNGLDAGAVGASSWYYLYVIYNPATKAVASLLSASSTAPALPAGYTFSARVGAVCTSSASALVPLQQFGRRAQYVVSAALGKLPLIISGISGNPDTPVWTACPLAPFVPPTAGRIVVVLSGGTIPSAQAMAAPNPDYGRFINGVDTYFNYAPLVVTTPATPLFCSSLGEIVLETMNLYYASSLPDGALECLGWEDNL